MKTQRTPDGITWEGLPSLFRELVPPQSDARFGDSTATQTFCAPAAFWRKLAQSLGDPAVRALWQPSLGQGIENVREGRPNRNTPETTDLPSFIAEAAPGFGDLLRESVRQPLLLADPADGEIACARLLLANGATAVVRVDAHQATLQDCFFSRPARECPADPADSPSRRQAAIRGMVLRHAGFDADAMRLVASTPNTLLNARADRLGFEENHPTSPFRNPAAWGFIFSSEGMRWEGIPASDDEPATASFRFIRRFTPIARQSVAADPASPEISPSRPDAAGCLSELAAALARLDALEQDRGDHAAPTDSDFQRAAYRLAAALGYCRLFGVQPADVAGEPSLPVHLLPRVARELTTRLTRWASDDLSHGNEQQSLWADEDRITGLFESRMEAWAVFAEIDRAAGPMFIGLDASTPIDAGAFDELLAAMESFDVTLQSHEHDLLATAPRLIANCQLLLAPRYRECAPWWLCESLSPLAK